MIRKSLTVALLCACLALVSANPFHEFSNREESGSVPNHFESNSGGFESSLSKGLGELPDGVSSAVDKAGEFFGNGNNNPINQISKDGNIFEGMFKGLLDIPKKIIGGVGKRVGVVKETGEKMVHDSGNAVKDIVKLKTDYIQNTVLGKTSNFVGSISDELSKVGKDKNVLKMPVELIGAGANIVGHGIKNTFDGVKETFDLGGAKLNRGMGWFGDMAGDFMEGAKNIFTGGKDKKDESNGSDGAD